MDLPDQRQEVRVVVYGIIGQLGLLVQGNLKFFANFDSLLIREAGLPGTSGPLRVVASDKEDAIATIRPSNFHQQGHIKYNRLDVFPAIILGNQFLSSRQYAGVNHFVQNTQFLRVGKDDLPQTAAVDLTRGVQNLSAELPDKLRTDRFLRQQVVGERVGPNDRAAQLLELGRHGALAGRDAANNSDNWLCFGIGHS